MKRKFIDYNNYIGKNIGRLLILGINEDESTRRKRIYFNCKCDCGNIVTINAVDIVKGYTNSCGCLRRDKMKRQTEIYMNDEKGYGIAFVKKGNDDNYFITFDKEYKNIIQNGAWYINNHGYIEGIDREYDRDNSKRRILLHRVIVKNRGENIDDKAVDHKNHNKSDLRSCNLRSCTISQNSMNNINKNNNRNIWYDPVVKLYKVTFKYTENGELRKISKAFKREEDAIEFRDKYIRESLNKDFLYNKDNDIRNNHMPEYYIGFPNNNLHPFYIVDGYSMPPANPFNVIQPFNGAPSIYDNINNQSIQPFEIINELKFNKG